MAILIILGRSHSEPIALFGLSDFKILFTSSFVYDCFSNTFIQFDDVGMIRIVVNDLSNIFFINFWIYWFYQKFWSNSWSFLERFLNNTYMVFNQYFSSFLRHFVLISTFLWNTFSSIFFFFLYFSTSISICLDTFIIKKMFDCIQECTICCFSFIIISFKYFVLYYFTKLLHLFYIFL